MVTKKRRRRKEQGADAAGGAAAAAARPAAAGEPEPVLTVAEEARVEQLAAAFGAAVDVDLLLLFVRVDARSGARPVGKVTRSACSSSSAAGDPAIFEAVDCLWLRGREPRRFFRPPLFKFSQLFCCSAAG